MAAPQLVWEIVKGHNSFLRKNLNGLTFSAEPGNLYNKNSYKYSGEYSPHAQLPMTGLARSQQRKTPAAWQDSSRHDSMPG